jgi:hypothetical protein
MKSRHLKQGQSQSAKLSAKVILAFSVSGIAAIAVFFGFYTLQMGRSEEAKAATTTYTTLTNGNWTNTATVWSTNGTTPCLCTPGASLTNKIVVIKNSINLNVDVTAVSGSSITVLSTGSLANTNFKLEIQTATITNYGTINVSELKMLAASSGFFYGPLSAVNKMQFDGTVKFDALTTLTNGNIQFSTVSVINVADGWQISMPHGSLNNSGTINFNGNVLNVLVGNVVNTGTIQGFGLIQTKNGTITNSGTWNSYVDWCSSGNDIATSGLTDPENCLDTTGTGTCGNAYLLDWKDATTYNVSCGDVNASNWSVKGMTCWFNSPLFTVPGVSGGANRLADWTVRVNQSGNVDGNDTASVYYYVNGTLARTDIYTGTGSPAVFTSARKLLVYAGGTYQVKIRLLNDKSNELWEIKSNDITSCLLPVFAPPSPLPVTLINFTAKAQNGNSVLLNWSTLAETNNDYFTIERSHEGTQFSALTQVDGAGSTTQIHKYSFTDYQPFSATSYYRLRQTDFNGKQAVFRIVPVTLAGNAASENTVTVSPNPFSHDFSVQFNCTEAGTVTIALLAMNGAVVFSDKLNAGEGDNYYHFSAPDGFKEGTYSLSIADSKTVLANKNIIFRK